MLHTELLVGGACRLQLLGKYGRFGLILASLEIGKARVMTQMFKNWLLIWWNTKG